MNKILKALTDVLALIFANRATITALKKEVADRDKIIADLQAAHEQDDADDASLEEAARAATEAKEAADASLARVIADQEAANAKADEVLAAISADPEVPVNVDGDQVTTQE